MENKKEYRLKRWYPSLYEDIEEGIEVEYKDGWMYYVNTRGNKTCVEFDEYEFNFTVYWEEVKQPLFITEDGVKIFSETSIEFYIVVNFIKYRSTISDFEDQKKLSHKVFYHESNADEYIWRNKWLFSYEDMMKAKHSIILTYEDIEKAAKGRSRNE